MKLKTKICTKCKKPKSLSEFHNNKNMKDGKQIWCKECHKKQMMKYYEENKEKILKHEKQYQQENKESISDYHKQYYQENKEKLVNQHKKYTEENKEKISKQIKKWYQDNKKEILEQRKRYCRLNREKIAKRKRKYQKERYNTDIAYKILSNLRSRLWHALKGNSKSASTLNLLGCSVEFLKNHLEAQFAPGMTWDNHDKDGWEIDHIKPCAKFDLTKESEQRKCFNYKNLQPLWAKDNLRKGGNV